MDLNIEIIGDVVVVILPGETLEANITQQFEQDIEHLFEETIKIVFDMNQIRFIDSMGCRVLITSHKRMQNKGGGLKLCCIRDQVYSIFNLMGFNQLFSIFKTREEAVSSFESSG
ncbi:MAG: STAS domain-containing protein [Deltaproteobacteria bacterium]|nr:STAS domain-containing protein [Deltaproteobacteria bacterium]